MGRLQLVLRSAHVSVVALPSMPPVVALATVLLETSYCLISPASRAHLAPPLSLLTSAFAHQAQFGAMELKGVFNVEVHLCPTLCRAGQLILPVFAATTLFGT